MLKRVNLGKRKWGVAEIGGENSQGIERFPRNLMEGTRSAWAAAWRKALVANILNKLLRKVVGSDSEESLSEGLLKRSLLNAVE